MDSLAASIQSRKKSAYTKLKGRFFKSLSSGSIHDKSTREQYSIVTRLKSLERQLGIKSSIRLKHWALAAVMGLISTVASAQTFTAKSFGDKPLQGGEFIVGDFDGDGSQDILDFKYNQSKVSLFLNDGTGNFDDRRIPQFVGLTQFYPNTLVVSDIDQDGDDDLLYRSSYGGQSMSILSYNVGSGFTAYQLDPGLSYGFSGSKIFVVDLDSDGDLDIISSSEDGSYVYKLRLLRNAGVKTFGTFEDIGDVPALSSPGSRAIHFGHFDNDGEPEMLVANGSTINIYSKTAGYTNFNLDNAANHSYFNLAGAYNSIITSDLFLHDFDGDGDLDIIYRNSYHDSNSLQSYNYGRIGLFENYNGDSLSAEATVFLGNISQRIYNATSIQFDVDGDLDIIVETSDGSFNYAHTVVEISGAFASTVFASNPLTLTQNAGGIYSLNDAFPIDIDGDGKEEILFGGSKDIAPVFGDPDLVSRDVSKVIPNLVDVRLAVDMATGDIDGDGDEDLVTVGPFKVWLNDGSGNFTDAAIVPTLSYGDMYDADQVSLALLDADANLDIIFTGTNLKSNSYPYDPVIISAINDGTGNFTFNETTHAISGINRSVAADIDADGDTELIVQTLSGPNAYFRIFEHDGLGNFGTPVSSWGIYNGYGAYDRSFTLFDADGDLDLDLAFPSNGSGYPRLALRVFAGGTLDSLAYPRHYLTGEIYSINQLLAGDFDGDGDSDDILAVNESYSSTTQFLFINDGNVSNSSFSNSTANILTIQASSYVKSGLIADIDQDGEDDVLISTEYNGNPQTEIFKGQTSVGIEMTSSETVSFGGEDIFSADFDGDNDPDIIYNTYFDYSLNYLVATENQSLQPNTAPTIAVLNSVSLAEGDSVVIASTDLQVTDLEQADSSIVFTIDNVPINGSFQLLGTGLVASDQFTQQDINLGNIRFVHNGTESTVDSLFFSVTDGTEVISGQVLPFAITPVNDPPVISRSLNLSVDEGSSGNLITVAELQAFDEEQPATSLTFSLKQLPATGTIALNGLDLGISGTFSQDDIDNLRVTYSHDDSENVLDSISFDLFDGVGGEALDQFFYFDIIPKFEDQPPQVAADTIYTSDSSPALTGTIDDTAAIIDVTVNGETHSATNNADGSWTLAQGTLTALTEGFYDVAIYSVDSINNFVNDTTFNALIIDQTAPSISITTLLTNDASPLLDGTIDDTTATIDVTVNGETVSATNNGDGTWTVAAGTLTALADGTYEVSSTATDLAGNSGTDASSNELTVDTQAPTVTVDVLATNSTSPALTGTVDDPTATIEVTVNGETVSATNNGDGTWTVAAGTLTALADGTYEVSSTSTDLAGNSGTDASSNELTVDTQAPTVTVDILATNSTSPALTGTVDDPTATIEVTVNGETVSATNNGDGTWTVAAGTLTTLADGTYEVSSTSTDLAGNSGTDASSNELTVDTQAPTVTVDVLATNSTSPALTGTVDDPTATIEVTVNGETVSAINNGDGTWTVSAGTLTALVDGIYEVSVTATDSVGNTGSDSSTNELTIDTQSLLVTVDVLATNNPSPALTGTIDDPAATIEVTVNGETVPATNNGDGTWSVAAGALTALADGTYEVSVTATDLLGNTGTDLSSSELTIDTQSPVVTVDVLATNNTSPGLSGTIDDATATIEVTVNGETVSATNNGDGTWTVAAGTLTALADGTYEVSVTATDDVGNTGSDATTVELTVETQVPVVTVDPLSTNDATPPLSGTIDDPTASVEVTVGGQTHSANVSGAVWTVADNTLAALTDGSYDIVVTATDPVGNVGTDATTDELFIDTQAPIVSVDNLVTPDRTPQLTGTINDPDATLSVTVDGQTFDLTNEGTGIWTLADNLIATLVPGIYDVSVTAQDVLGNVGTDATTDELTILGQDPGRPLDSAALVTIYQQTGGPKWKTRTNWLKGPITSWYGVTVTEDRVVKLNLNGNGLTGTFPEVTSGMELLDSLLLGDNELTSVLTSNLSGLDYLDVSGNRLVFTQIASLQGNGYELSFSDQKEVLTRLRVLLQLEESYTVDRSVPGGESYTWFQDGSQISQSGSSFSITVNAFEDEAIYHAEVTSSSFPGLVLTTQPVDVRVSSLRRDETSLRAVLDDLVTDASQISVDWQNTPVEQWDEVTLSGNNDRVVGIDFSGKKLAGDMPEDLLDVAGLTTIDISDNDITSIPDMSPLTELTTMNASGNKLDFGSIEPNFSNSAIAFGTQQPIGESFNDTIPRGANYFVELLTPGESLEYQWMLKGADIAGANSSIYQIENIDYDKMGAYTVKVTSTQAPGITLTSEPQNILAYGSIEFYPSFTFADGELAFVEEGTSTLMKIKEMGPYDTIRDVAIENSKVYFEKIVLGDYLLSMRAADGYQRIKEIIVGSEVIKDTVTFIPTYYRNVIEWDNADTLRLREFLEDTVLLTRRPPPLLPDPDNTGTIGMTVESDFPEGSSNSRVESRRRVRKAGCSLRRNSRVGGGREEEDDEWVLIAYQETDDEGRVDFGNLPNGLYRINIQYPGIPMDPDSFIEFTIDNTAEDGDGYVLAATVYEDGIQVEVVEELGYLIEYFKDLNIYPNPADKSLTIRYRKLNSENISYQLINLQGMVLVERDIQSGYHQEVQLETSEFPEGIYLLRFIDKSDRNAGLITYKIIIRH